MKPWSPGEDAVLLQHALQCGTKQWGELERSGQLKRNNKSCCNRYIFLRRKFVQRFQQNLLRRHLGGVARTLRVDMDGHSHCQEQQQQQRWQHGEGSPESQSSAHSFGGLSYEECRSVFLSPNACSTRPTDPHLPSLWIPPTASHTAVLTAAAAALPNTAAVTNAATYASSAALSLPMKRAREECSALTTHQPLLWNASWDALGLPRRVARRPLTLEELLHLRGERCRQQQALWPAVGSQRAWFAHLLSEERRQQQGETSAVQRALWPRVESESALPDDVLLGCSSDEPAFIQRSSLSAPPPSQPRAVLPSPIPPQLAALPGSAPCTGDFDPCYGELAPCFGNAPSAAVRAAVQQQTQSVDSCSHVHVDGNSDLHAHDNSYEHNSRSDVHAHDSSNHDVPVHDNSNVLYGRSESLFLDVPVSHLCLAEPAPKVPPTDESPAPPGGRVALPEWAVEQGRSNEGGFANSSPQHSHDTLSHPRAPHIPAPMPPPALPHAQPHVFDSPTPTPVKPAIGPCFNVGDALGGDSASWESSFPPGLNSNVPSATSLLGCHPSVTLPRSLASPLLPAYLAPPFPAFLPLPFRLLLPTPRCPQAGARQHGGGGAHGAAAARAGGGYRRRWGQRGRAARESTLFHEVTRAERVGWDEAGGMGGSGWDGTRRVGWEEAGGMGRGGWDGRKRVGWDEAGGMGRGGWDGTRRVGWEEAGGMGGSGPARRNVYSQELEAAGIAMYQCAPNRAEEFHEVLDAVQPTIAVFDRFTSEEAFSFRVRQRCPACLLVLDTQDLHFLRAGRQQVVSEGGSIRDALHHVPDTSSRELLRELASMHRCDLTLLCSQAELALLTRCYAFPPHKLALTSFFYDSPEALPDSTSPSVAPALPPWEQRQHCVMLGTFRHAPNVDAVCWLASHIWPLIRAQLPMAECHVYGSYVTAAISSLHSPSSGFIIRGHAPSLDMLASYRVLLAPLRYGAGIKGKVLDSWRHGTPVVTTPIGAEGMGGRGGGWGEAEPGEGKREHGEAVTEGEEEEGGGQQWEGGQQWGGLCEAGDAEAFAADAVRLYSDPQLWSSCQSTVRCLPSTASPPLPPLHCLPSTASPPLPPLHCLPSTASPPLPPLHCLPPTASPPLPPLHCLPSTASPPLPPLHCLPSTASPPLPPLHCLPCAPLLLRLPLFPRVITPPGCVGPHLSRPLPAHLPPVRPCGFCTHSDLPNVLM
ncbi:unnamed protein product [Closterium sp. Naga37s-1]|nr:unnamed protein product [Closterium sp. Naga37s-1]